MAQKALLVGINDYRSINDLQGCVNDVTNMRNVLKTYFGFDNEETRILVDSRATKANILERLKWLTDGAKAGDFLVFHFSGHGSQIRDRNGDEISDGIDELICPYDMNWDGQFIIDDDLDKIFNQIPQGVLLEVFLDCCHSGTGLRDISFGRPEGLGPENPTQYRYLPPPIDIECRFEGEEEKLTKKGFKSESRSTVRHILWAGCKDNQTSADAYISGTYNGAFTYFFCKHLRDSGGNLSRNELLKRIRNSLSYGGYSQTPQLEGETTVANMKVLTP
jgi:hypothetical protein